MPGNVLGDFAVLLAVYIECVAGLVKQHSETVELFFVDHRSGTCDVMLHILTVAVGENIVFCDLSGLERLHYIDLNTGVGRVKRCALCLRQGLRRLWSRDILTK